MTEEIIKTREATHGKFAHTAATAVKLATLIHTAAKEAGVEFSYIQSESLAQICTKIARICCGDPNFPDHWDDISGYSLLSLKEISDEVR